MVGADHHVVFVSDVFMRSSVAYVFVGVVHSWVFGRSMYLLCESALNNPLGLLVCVVLFVLLLIFTVICFSGY